MPNLGKKHTCKKCETRFFDLKKNPAVCPKCGEKIKIIKPRTKRASVPLPETAPIEAPQDKIAAVPNAPEAADTVPGKDDGNPVILEGSDEVHDLEAELEDDQDEEGLMEDTSDIGEDNDDMSEVLDHVDDGVADK